MHFGLHCLMTALIALGVASAHAAPRTSAHIFYSGHSLMDQPLPDYVARIAGSLGTTARWNRQYVVGSSIRQRTRGVAPTGWAGYRQGYNRDGDGLDVVAELREPRTLDGERYDTLVITEQHGLLGTLVWNDTVRHLRHYHDRFIAGNAAGQTWFYEPWLGLHSKDDPSRWIAYERAAAPVWQCIATRVNVSLAGEGRADRIARLPAGLALAALVEAATASRLPGVTAATVRATVDGLVKDNVHLTPTGAYYMALVTYATVYGRSTEGAWAPPTIGAEAARTLQRFADRFVADQRVTGPALDLAGCKTLLRDSFIDTYWTYTRDTYWLEDLGWLRAQWRWLKHRVQWHLRFARDDEGNPFHHDARTDRGYWFPAP